MKMARINLGLIIFIIIAVVIGVYAYSRSLNYFKGPNIVLSCPRTMATTTTPFVEIRGRAERIAKIRLNQRPIFTDDAGVFIESLLLMPGYNILALEAGDIFGRSTNKTIELIYFPPPELDTQTEVDQIELEINDNLSRLDN